jgi:hypothetical protein
MKDIAEVSNLKVTSEQPKSGSATSSSSGAKESNPAFATIDQQRSQAFQAQQLGFKKDHYCVPKSAKSPGIYLIQGYNGESVTIAEMKNGKPSDGTTVTARDIIDNWKVHKGSVSTIMTNWTKDGAVQRLLDNKLWTFEAAKGACTLAMRQVNAIAATYGWPFDIIQKPHAVKATGHIGAGDVLLAPATMKFDTKQVAHSIAITKMGDDTVYMNPTFTPPPTEDGSKVVPWICPFWIVKQVEAKDTPTMVVHWVKIEMDGFKVTVPFLVNKSMGDGTEFTVHKHALKAGGKAPMAWDAFVDKYTIADESKAKKRKKQ